jgi:hypothetical protein
VASSGGRCPDARRRVWRPALAPFREAGLQGDDRAFLNPWPAGRRAGT